MAELTPEERDALTHWSMHGRPGEPQVETFVPDAATRARFKDPLAPESAPITLQFDAGQTAALLRGFNPREMEDKWMVAATVSNDAATASVGFYRSWTGNLMLLLDVRLESAGAEATRLTWETSPERIKVDGDAEYWRGQLVEVCRWVLGMATLAE